MVEVPEPNRGVQIPDVSSTADERGGGGGPSLSATESEHIGSPVGQMVAPERIVVLPEADPSADEDALSSFESLGKQLAEFRALLRGPEIDGDASGVIPPDRWTDVG